MTAAPARNAADPWLSHAVRIAAKTAEIADVATYDFEFTDPRIAAGYRFLPGQFDMVYLPGVGESAISLSADPKSRERWSHTIRAAGNVTQALARLDVGATLGLRGPFGSSWPVDACVGQDLILVAGGIGLAPLRPVIYHVIGQRSQYESVTVLHGARTPDSLLFAAEYDAWRAVGVDVQTTADRSAPGWNGNVGVVTLLLDRLKWKAPDRTTLFACGPEVMMRFTAKCALGRGIVPERLWLSTERNMQCAVGFCGHCQWGPAFVCKDGPVFRYDRLAPFIAVESF
jgi:NAD(P)H-flavin reductase